MGEATKEVIAGSTVILMVAESESPTAPCGQGVCGVPRWDWTMMLVIPKHIAARGKGQCICVRRGPRESHRIAAVDGRDIGSERR